MLIVGSQGVLYPLVLFSYFCKVLILIAVFRRRRSTIASTTVLPKPIYYFLRGVTALLPTA
jgi:hypothetical protein